MPVLSPKRQITVPKDLCDRLRIRAGDELDIFEYEGRVTLIKKRKGASDGVLRNLKRERGFSDEESLMDTVASRQSPVSED